MGTINTYIVYHATDESNVASIVKDNFIFHPKATHWLGDGVYFFLDKALAVSWGKNCPTKKYGSINKFAIVEAIVQVDSDFVCDMRKLDTFNEVKQAFEIFWKYNYKIPATAKHDNAFFEKLECAFFNWLAKKRNLSCIVCNFEKRKIETVSNSMDNFFKGFNIIYVETQMCVKDSCCIKERRLLGGGSNNELQKN